MPFYNSVPFIFLFCFLFFFFPNHLSLPRVAVPRPATSSSLSLSMLPTRSLLPQLLGEPPPRRPIDLAASIVAAMGVGSREKTPTPPSLCWPRLFVSFRLWFCSNARAGPATHGSPGRCSTKCARVTVGCLAC
uniref:Secreted protein n=1 Tax=Oryza punctata TaxID=4537 RepID=A0A0E0KNT4_ORYPU